MSEQTRATSQSLVGIPRCARGYGPGEFLYFQWIANIDANKFKVIIEDLAGRWVSLGKLQARVFIPNTYFDPHATLVIVGLNNQNQQVRYVGEMTRGNMYLLHTDRAGNHSMQKFIPQHNLN